MQEKRAALYRARRRQEVRGCRTAAAAERNKTIAAELVRAAYKSSTYSLEA